MTVEKRLRVKYMKKSNVPITTFSIELGSWEDVHNARYSWHEP